MAKNRNVDEFPSTTKRIWGIIESECGGNVKKFTDSLGMANGSKVQRLFVKDKRNGSYPTPSTDIVTMIVEKYPQYSAEYVLMGRESCNGVVNNISVTSNKTNGNNNVVGDNNSVEMNERMMSIIEQQQTQINALFKIIAERVR